MRIILRISKKICTFAPEIEKHNVIMLLLLIFLVLTLPIRWIIKKETNYERAIKLRKACNILLYIFVGVAIISAIISLLLKINFEDKSEMFGGLFFLFFFMPLYYYWVKSLLNIVDFYDESIISDLRYYILYLRSFKDDHKRDKEERKCMEMLYCLFCPYTVGIPSEFSPSEGAPRIYIGDKWKEQVSDLMHRAPIVFFRINETENFLWEVEQCLDNNFLEKSLFWIKSIPQYQQFALFMKEKGVTLPPIDTKQLNSILYFNNNNEAVILPVKSAMQRYAFFKQYTLDKAELLKPYYSYFYGNNKKLNLFFSRNYDAKLMPEVKQWSTAALLFPGYYILFHSFPYRYWSYIALLLFDVLTILSIAFGLTYALSHAMYWLILLCILLPVARLAFSYFMGRNARTMVWLSEKWTSLQEYQQSTKKADLATYILGTILSISIITMIFFIL